MGKMGQIRAKAIEESGRGRVAAVYEPSQQTESPYRRTESDIELIDDPEVDSVFICTPNYRIKPLVIAALDAGKHVFSEKPPGKCAADVEEMMAAEQASGGKTLMFGFNHRHHGSIRKMKEIVESGEMGRLLWMRGRYGKEVDEQYFGGWRANKELAGGGIMLDQGIHMLDLFLHLGGGFDEVQSMVSNLFWKIDGIEDNVFANFRSSGTGVCASLHSTMTQWRYIFSLEVFLEGGAMILNGLKTSSGAYGDEALAIKRNEMSHLGRFDNEEKIVYHVDTSWNSEIEDFLSCVNEQRKPSHGNSFDALALMRLIDQVYQSYIP